MVVVALYLFIQGCDKNTTPLEEVSKDSPQSETNSSVQSDANVTMQFKRIPQQGLDGIEVHVTFKEPINNFNPAVDKGQIQNVKQTASNRYQFELYGDKSGEYKISVNYHANVYTRTALILQDVSDEWEQPLSVEGYVNTQGYEDGVTITPDGEYLFVQTGPYRFSSLFVYAQPRENGGCGGSRLEPSRCNHPWINETIGTYSAPKRPHFFTSRFDGNRQLHNALSWGLNEEEAPVFAMTTMFYGFKRQHDGSFKEPFYMAFDDLNDGIIGPFGLSFLKQEAPKKYTTIFAFKDAYTTNGSFDVYWYDATFEEDNTFGVYQLNGVGKPPLRTTNFASTLVDFGDNNGTQGNPFLYAPDGKVQSIWCDDEYDNDADRNKISVYFLNSGDFKSSSNWSKIVLPSTVNEDSKAARQPTFVNNQLFFAQDVNIALSKFNAQHTAKDLANPNNWSKPEIILQKDTSYNFYKATDEDIGKIIAIGEPTIATVDGKEVLYFVYGYIRSIDPITGLADLDMQAGYIKHR